MAARARPSAPPSWRRNCRCLAHPRLADAAQRPVRSARRHAADLGLRDGADPPGLCRRSAAHRQAGEGPAGRQCAPRRARMPSGGTSAGARTRVRVSIGSGAAARAHGAAPVPDGAPTLRGLEDIALLAAEERRAGAESAYRERHASGAAGSRADLEFRPSPRAPRTPGGRSAAEIARLDRRALDASRSPTSAARPPWPSRRKTPRRRASKA